MRLKIGNAKEICAGVLFLALGVFVLAYARSYAMGTATDMGPGYFPTMLAVLLCCGGLIAIIQGLRAAQHTPIGPWPLVPLAFVVVGVLGFAALIEGHGLFPAVIVLILFACYGRLRHRPIEVAMLCVVLLALAYVVFIYGIDLPLDFW
jgi:hypothetical protein